MHACMITFDIVGILFFSEKIEHLVRRRLGFLYKLGHAQAYARQPARARALPPIHASRFLLHPMPPPRLATATAHHPPARPAAGSTTAAARCSPSPAGASGPSPPSSRRPRPPPCSSTSPSHPHPTCPPQTSPGNCPPRSPRRHRPRRLLQHRRRRLLLLPRHRHLLQGRDEERYAIDRAEADPNLIIIYSCQHSDRSSLLIPASNW